MEARSARRIDTPESVYAVVEKLPRFDPCETGFVFYLDAFSQLISVDVVRGREGGLSFRPSSIISRAKTLGSPAVVLAHTHPEGNAAYSLTDLVSDRLLRSDMGKAGIDLAGNYIVAGFRARRFSSLP